VTEEQRKRRRRAVRPAGTVGGDEANLRSSFPAPAPDEVTWGKQTPGSSARPARTSRAPDDEDLGWGAPAADSNDDRLNRDRPPHW
jgi:hypothetical protein